MREITVPEWASKVETNLDVINHPNRKNMREFIEKCGGDFSEVERFKKWTQKWTNLGNANTMELVFGLERWTSFKKWAKNYSRQYEATTYVKQGRLESGKVGSGEIRMLCLMTRYAAFTSDSEDPYFRHGRFAIEVGVRRKNGELRDRGVSHSQFHKLSRPDTGEVYIPGSFPPGYIEALVYEMETWKK